MIMLLVQVDLSQLSQGAIRLLCRALADYSCPAVQVHSCKVFHAPYRIGSGSYLTAHGNTWRHSFVADYVLDSLADQGLISQEEEEYLRQFDVLGDDFRGLVIRRETAELFDKTIDQVFGTITTTSTPPIFGTPNEGDSLEFLRRRHVRIGDEIRTFREPVRVLAKLIHGTAATNVSRFVASLQAMLCDVGYYPWLHQVLLSLIPDCAVNQAEYEAEVERKVRKVPSIAATPQRRGSDPKGGRSGSEQRCREHHHPFVAGAGYWRSSAASRFGPTLCKAD